MHSRPDYTPVERAIYVIHPLKKYTMPSSCLNETLSTAFNSRTMVDYIVQSQRKGLVEVLAKIGGVDELFLAFFKFTH